LPMAVTSAPLAHHAGRGATMSKRRLIQLSINRAEAMALVVGLSEYLYLREEGDLSEVLDELELTDADEPLSAGEAADLLARLEAHLG
jgi:hypothetical protein